MKILRFFLLAFYAFALSQFINAQDPHVRTRYAKDSKTTIIETDWMYVINTPQQFMQLGLVTRYPNERLEKPPKKIDFHIWSFSREALYKQDKGPALKVNTDGDVWSVDSLIYLVFKGETRNGQDIFWAEKRPELGQPSLLPKNAQLKGQEGVNGLFMEQIIVEFTPEQLLKIAQAKKVEMQMGTTRFGFKDDQMNTIRDFNNRLVPGALSIRDVNAQESTPKPSQKPGEAVDVGVVNGKAISLPRPEYPGMAREVRASGSVKVFVTIDETGKVIAARAISGHPLLHEVSEAAARQARFKPPMISGKPVKVSGIIIYNFVL